LSTATSNKPVASNVARIIEKKGFKQKAIAERMGITNQMLSDMLNGRKAIRPEDSLLLMNALGINASELYQE
jgi:Plasmid maintenance system antidote protein